MAARLTRATEMDVGRDLDYGFDVIRLMDDRVGEGVLEKYSPNNQ